MTDTDQAAIPAAQPEPTPSILPRPSEIMYGARKEPEQPKPEPTPSAEPEGREAEPPADDGGEGAEAERTTESGAEQDGEAISTLPDLIEQNEWDQEWFDGLKVPVKINGEAGEATISELVSSYRTQKAAEDRLEKAKEKSEASQREWSEKSQALEGQYATAAKLIEGAEKLLEADTAAINWSDLRESDPAEYSAKKEEVRERREKIEAVKREAFENWKRSAGERQQAGTEEYRKVLEAENQALMKALPEWQDEAKAKEEKTEIVKALVNDYGFTEDDVKSAADHRLILMARDAMLYRKGREKVDATKKKFARPPKTMKGGAKPDASKPKPKNAAEILYG